MNKLMPALFLVAAMIPQAQAFGQNNPMQTIEDILEEYPADSANPRARFVRAALSSARKAGDAIRYGNRENPQVHDNGYCAVTDCSGYVFDVMNVPFKMEDIGLNHGNASTGKIKREMKKIPDAYKPQTEVPVPVTGNIVFFGKYDNPGELDHVGIYLKDGKFLHIRENTVDGLNVQITSLDDFASPRGIRPQVYYRGIVQGYGDIEKLPPRGQEGLNQLLAATNYSREAVAGPDVPGGVYISPALVLEAMQMDDSGILEAIEEIVLSDQMRERFRQNPVQELDIVIPPGFE